MASTPMTTISPRSAAGGIRRPMRAPTTPPTNEPDRDEQDHPPVDRVAGEEHEGHRGDRVDHAAEHVLVGVQALQRLRAEGAEDPHEQDALGRTEVPAVDPGDEDADAQRPAVPARLRAPSSAARPPGAGARDRRGRAPGRSR